MSMVKDPSARNRMSRHAIACLSALLLLTSIFLCDMLSAQSSDSKTSDANQSWTSTRDSHDAFGATRTVENHTHSGNRTVDRQSVVRTGPDGNNALSQDIEKETVQVNPSTVRTITRTFGRNGSGDRTLVQVTEEETETLPGGGSKSVRTTSNPDANGNLQPVQRDVAETKKISSDVDVTKTTVMLPSPSGLTPSTQIEERRKHTGNNTEFQTTTSILDLGGKWQVSEVRQGTIKEEGKNRSSEERVSRPDAGGYLSEVSRTVKKEAESASGEKRNVVEHYSIDVPGSTRDGSLHMVQRETSTESVGLSGRQTSVQQVEPNPGDPGAGMRVITISNEAGRSGPAGTQATRTLQVRNASGSFDVVSVDTSKSDKTHAIQVQIAPSNKPK